MLAAGNQAVPEKGPRKPFQGGVAATGKDALSLLAWCLSCSAGGKDILVLKSIQEIWGNPGESGSSPAFPMILKRAPD